MRISARGVMITLAVLVISVLIRVWIYGLLLVVDDTAKVWVEPLVGAFGVSGGVGLVFIIGLTVSHLWNVNPSFTIGGKPKIPKAKARERQRNV